MIASVHIAKPGFARSLAQYSRKLRADDVPGLRHATFVLPAQLTESVLPAPSFRSIGLIAAWDDEASLDAFTQSHPRAEVFAGGYNLRMRPVRIVGEWPEFGDLEIGEPDSDGPFAVLTLGKLRLTRAPAFLRASAKAERDVVGSPGLLMTSGLARPPHLVATFSVWEDVASMRNYVARSGHSGATAINGARPFHHQSAFIRFQA